MGKRNSVKRRAVVLLSGGILCNLADAQEIDSASASETPVVTITGNFSSDLRPYSRYLPGIREFEQYHQLAPAAELRFCMVTGSFPMKPLRLTKARLEKGFLWNAWSEDLPVQEDGWFTISESEEAERRNANVVVSRRNAASARWVIDVHTPGLPPQVYRLGDLRLECRVYLAIEWAVWHGRLVMGRERDDVNTPPMDAACSGQRWVFVNTRPWPRLQAYVLSEGKRMVRHELNGLRINITSFSLDLSQDEGSPLWSDDARVEFVFFDDSHWVGKPVKAPGP
ncbi:hypothetical protein [Massilia horti]|uniref:Uncharacterized protein n=1 Tax=Massilia horti TaxID=2562153 RepID=A0A4Y9T802_9BURK|nr:hypothetical protein [Massilia horti]TFW35658.1 hypothetical protein E4O92_01490 [Massilia horti]